jgi:hypothetical protein
MAPGHFEMLLTSSQGSCEPTTCEAEGKNCGYIDDGCGGEIQCGECPDGWECGVQEDNVCYSPDPETFTITVSALSPGIVDTYSCGNPSDISGGWSYKQYASYPSMDLVFTLPLDETWTPLQFSPKSATGVVSGNSDEQWSSWENDCYAELDRVASTLGDRFLAATCSQPTDIYGGYSYHQYSGALQVWAAPAKPLEGLAIDVTGYLVGSYLSGEDAALASWDSECDLWMDQMTGLTQGITQTWACGAYGDISGGYSYKQLASEPAMSVRTDLVLNEELVTFIPKQAVGVVSGDRNEQFSSWRDDCFDELATLKSNYGPRFITGVCGEPSDVYGGYSYKQYAGPIRIYLEPL